ncbi:peptidyl-prolyl cis-trans isomerase FKBP17-2, chloroplastic isoform X2 [Euphorbia lathyris]|uniref:peptidyl-prolyl cis-trans isomerase FKBP17-2, chloroplastic isoform X2 n=1 Tax=Euphorbia lathyris TaxID=212925 RepID=UPI0033133F4A
MATFFGSPPFLSHPIPKTNNNHFSSSPNPPPSTPSSSSQPQGSTPLSQQSYTSSSKQPEVVKVQKQKPSSASSSSPGKVDSTDWIASTLTRRFGLGAGLAWASFLAFGVVSEQLKTRFEVSQERANTRDIEKEEEVVLPNAIRYIDLRVGGGATPRKGDLVVIDLKGKVEGSEKAFVDTFGGENKSLALVMGSRPYSKGMCEGIEYVLRSMKAGGKRKVIIPSNLGFGENGAEFA